MLSRLHFSRIFFFFQAEDGIRDDLVTGVQTCALPILAVALAAGVLLWLLLPGLVRQGPGGAQRLDALDALFAALALAIGGAGAGVLGSEERRGGKEGKSRGAPEP